MDADAVELGYFRSQRSGEEFQYFIAKKWIMILIREQGQTFFQISFQNWNQYMLYCITYAYKIYYIIYVICKRQISIIDAHLFL